MWFLSWFPIYTAAYLLYFGLVWHSCTVETWKRPLGDWNRLDLHQVINCSHTNTHEKNHVNNSLSLAPWVAYLYLKSNLGKPLQENLHEHELLISIKCKIRRGTQKVAEQCFQKDVNYCMRWVGKHSSDRRLWTSRRLKPLRQRLSTNRRLNKARQIKSWTKGEETQLWIKIYQIILNLCPLLKM